MIKKNPVISKCFYFRTGTFSTLLALERLLPGEYYHSILSYYSYSGKDTVIWTGHAQKESIMGGIIIFLTTAPIVDPFPVWKPAFPYSVKSQQKTIKAPSRGLWVP